MRMNSTTAVVGQDTHLFVLRRPKAINKPRTADTAKPTNVA
jgi:hypothetical protein